MIRSKKLRQALLAERRRVFDESSGGRRPAWLDTNVERKRQEGQEENIARLLRA